MSSRVTAAMRKIPFGISLASTDHAALQVAAARLGTSVACLACDVLTRWLAVEASITVEKREATP